MLCHGMLASGGTRHPGDPTLSEQTTASAPAADGEGAAELVARIEAGDRRAEEELVTRYGRGVALLLSRHTRSHEEAEDLYQEVFRLALEKLRRGDLRQAEKLPAYLGRMARNLAIEHYRKARRRATEPDSEKAGTAAVPSSQLQRLVASEQAFQVRRILGELHTERDRQILFRFYIGDEDKDAICADLGLTSGQFNRVLHRARRRYRDLYLRHATVGGTAGAALSAVVLVALVTAAALQRLAAGP